MSKDHHKNTYTLVLPAKNSFGRFVGATPSVVAKRYGRRLLSSKKNKAMVVVRIARIDDVSKVYEYAITRRDLSPPRVRVFGAKKFTVYFDVSLRVRSVRSGVASRLV